MSVNSQLKIIGKNIFEIEMSLLFHMLIFHYRLCDTMRSLDNQSYNLDSYIGEPLPIIEYLQLSQPAFLE